MSRLVLWAFRVVWASLPVTAGPGFAAALDEASRPVQVTASVALWAGWAAGVGLSLVPTTTSLTFVRTLVPAAPVAAGAAVAAEATTSTVVALASTLLAMVLVSLAELGQVFAQGSAYGRERRYLLRPPTALLLGPLELAWLVSVGALGAGVLLLAAEQWWAGGPLVAVGALLVVPVVRRFHGLSQRWLVFVPAGVVVHDHLVLAETAMVPTRSVVDVRLGAPGGSATATDLTGGVRGRTVELRFASSQPFVLTTPGRTRTPRPLSTDRVAIAPSRPGAAVATAHGET